ncbi:hypothetical protein DVS28_a3569 [Euzebya pacifica]|uniref:Uncharacterized protein n=1 Tax=Euzebya pacifica TaxID=1608957 RepID=A0A346Y195_9ACTN|nr:hypothetical protein [Euzebya pacifica]AXV08242.1 hypothetical protein DVS28_a3569 [Euzebya pacifica]
MRRIIGALGALTLAVVMALPAGAATTTVVVGGDTASAENEPGWLFNRDVDTATPYAFTNDQASIGAGSVYIEPIGGANRFDKFIAELFVLTPIADVESLSYDFLIGNGGTAADENEFYLNVYANFGDSSPTKFFDCVYNVVPRMGSTLSWTTVTFDPSQPYPFRQSGSAPHDCPDSPADMETISEGSVVRAFALNVGDTSTNDVGLDGHYDNVVLTADGDTTIYDFEVDEDGNGVADTAPPTDKDDCKKGGWATFDNPSFPNQGQCIKYVNTGK